MALTAQDRLDRLGMCLSRSRRVDGIWLGVLGTRADDPTLDLTEAALVLIRTYDPRRYGLLQRRLDRIFICPLIGALGSFSDGLKTCKLDHQSIAGFTPDWIASIIVHEATHAHPWLRRVGYTEDVRYRVEAICLRQQLEFARKLPGSAVMCETLERWLTAPPSLWSDASLQRIKLAGEGEAARAYGLPELVPRICGGRAIWYAPCAACPRRPEPRQ